MSIYVHGQINRRMAKVLRTHRLQLHIAYLLLYMLIAFLIANYSCFPDNIHPVFL